MYMPDNLVIVGAGNGFSPIGRKAITRINIAVLEIVAFGANLSETLIKIQLICLNERHVKLPAANW